MRAEENLLFLAKDSSVLELLSLDSLGVRMFASSEEKLAGTPEIRIDWKDVGEFLKILDEFSPKEVYDIYKGRKISSLYFHKKEKNERIQARKSLQGLKVALDPGHFAGSMKEARQEQRLMELDGSDYGVKRKLRFYEADLTYSTALILKRKLEEAGAEVFISRPKGKSALGSTFKKWYKKEFRNVLNRDLASGEMDQETFDWWINKATKRQIFNIYFKGKDFEARADHINSWRPDLTFIIHYNADPSGNLKTYERNYCMAFVGGGFTKKELNSSESRLEFLRLLLSEDLEQSITLSSFWVEAHKDLLNIPAVLEPNNVEYLNKYSVYTGRPGVYSRNLALSRRIHGTICYGESLLQENIHEAQALARKDYRDGKIKTSKRIEEVSEAYFQAVIKFYNLDLNK
ncbi:hypothetical protein E1171_16660 [Cytophagales bacterium RKSG123]|nr:hypothetical protein [Xanthovirga aplysinae]